MSVEYLQALLTTAEDMLATASSLPEKSASRDDPLRMVRAYVSNIALLMNAVELGLKARVSGKD